MTVRLAALAFALLTASSGMAQTFDPTNFHLEVIVETADAAPYEGEEVLIRIRGSYLATITLQELEQPELEGFSWMQLGRDSWRTGTLKGRQARQFERVMAIFPERPGRLEIPPFTHHLTLIDSNGRRFTHDVSSAPTSVQAQRKPQDAGWWLPASDVRLIDEWDVPPDQIPFGELAHRTVTLEAAGLGPEHLPPAPSMRAARLISFSDPEQRSTWRTPEGPISRVVWRWTIKPTALTGTTLPEIRMPWFDTVSREMKEAVLPATRIAISGAPQEGPATPTLASRLAGWAAPVGALAGIALGLALLAPGLRLRSASERARLLRRLGHDPEARALRRAARRRDPGAVRAAALRLLRRDGTASASAEALLAELDRALFAPPGAAPAVELRAFARRFLKSARSRRVLRA